MKIESRYRILYLSSQAQKKWLAGAAANHLSDSRVCFPAWNQVNNENSIKGQTNKRQKKTG